MSQLHKTKLWKEITVYVHGITPEKNVGSHKSTYNGLHNIINKELQRLGKPILGKSIMTEWGWEGSEGEDRILDSTSYSV